MAHRIFVSKDQLPIITGSDVHYIKDVLRLKANDQLELLDGCGTIYLAKIVELNKETVVCQIISGQQDSLNLKVKVTIAQALPKAAKMDLIIQKSTELGVSQIIPMLSERCVAKKAKLGRWQKIAKEASEQCGRADLPAITELQSFAQVLSQGKNFDLALIPWELEKTITLKQVLKNLTAEKPLTLLIVIGPEGGFSQQEVEQAKAHAFTSVSLGPRILRTETVALNLLSIINYVFS